MKGMLYRLSDGLSRAWNKLVLVPGLQSTFQRYDDNATLGCRFEVAGARNISAGHDVYFGPGATLFTTRAEIRVGDYAMRGPNRTTITGDSRTDALDRPMMSLPFDERLSGNDQDVVIGSDIWLDSGVTALKGVAFADHCVVDAGAVVTRGAEPPFSARKRVLARMISMRHRAAALTLDGEFNDER